MLHSTIKTLQNSHISIVGATGFVGTNLRALFDGYDIQYNEFCSGDWDLLQSDGLDMPKQIKHSDYIFYLVGDNGGLEYYRSQSSVFFNNITMHYNFVNSVERFCRKAKVVSLSASCAYNSENGYMGEKDIVAGLPHESVLGHGLAKRVQFFTEMIANTANLNKYMSFCPPTLFGIYDSVDPKKCKFVNAIILKCIEAKHSNSPLCLIGTGETYRDILHVDDCLDFVVDSAVNKDTTQYPVPLRGHLVSIKELVDMVVVAVGFHGEVIFDMNPTKNGITHKQLVSQANEINFDLENQIQNTVEWYEEQLKNWDSA